MPRWRTNFCLPISWLSNHLEKSTTKKSVHFHFLRIQRNESQLSNNPNSYTGHNPFLRDERGQSPAPSRKVLLGHEAFDLTSSSVVYGQAGVLFSDQISCRHSEWREDLALRMQSGCAGTMPTPGEPTQQHFPVALVF